MWSDDSNAALRPFLDFANNDAPLRYKCLVDVFNGKCYYAPTPEPEENAAPLLGTYDQAYTTGFDIELD